MPVDGDPRGVLSASRALAHRVRRAQRGTWIPLAIFAALSFGAIPIERWSHFARTCRPVPTAGPGGRVCLVYATASLVYWPIALVLAYAAVAALYVHRSRARGVGTRIWPYVAAGVVIAAVTAGVSLWAAHNPPIGAHGLLGLSLGPQSTNLLFRLASAACAIGLALLVLAWVERSTALLAFALAYLVVVLVPVDFGLVVHHPSPWFFLPRLAVDGGLLLLGAIGFAAAERPGRATGR